MQCALDWSCRVCWLVELGSGMLHVAWMAGARHMYPVRGVSLTRALYKGLDHEHKLDPVSRASLVQPLVAVLRACPGCTLYGAHTWPCVLGPVCRD